jgi:hypothetical protein
MDRKTTPGYFGRGFVQLSGFATTPGYFGREIVRFLERARIRLGLIFQYPQL